MTKRNLILGLTAVALLMCILTVGVQGQPRILRTIFGGTGTGTIPAPGSVPFGGTATVDGSYQYDSTNLTFNSGTGTLTAGVLASLAGVSGTTGAFSSTVSGTTGSFTTAVSQAGANGQVASIKSLTEVTTIAAGATTDTTIQIPANAIVLGVPVRVTTIIPTAATFTVIGTGDSNAFQVGTNVAVAAGTTNAGTKSCPYLNASAQTIRITPNATPAANTGRVRVTVYYIEVTPPTS